ncbi:MAG: patatin-like phospholipase family protein [Gemmatimonadota bacterium]
MPNEKLALVLSGGGARAAYQAGAVSALAELHPNLAFPIITGVSAGAINAGFLAAHIGSLPDAAAQLRSAWEDLTAARVYHLRPAGLFLSTARRILMALVGQDPGPAHLPGILDLEPLRNYLGKSIRFLDIQEKIDTGRLRAFALSATPYTNAPTRTFVQGIPDIPMWKRAERISVRASISVEHVLASAAIPLVFPAIWLDGEFYGDGSVRQTAPLAPAIHLGASRILVIGTRHPDDDTPHHPTRTQNPTAAEGMGLLFNSIFLDALDADAERLTRINRLVESLPPDFPVPDGLRSVKFYHLRPSRDLSTLVTGQHYRLPWTMRTIVRAMGGESAGSTVLLSYMLFDPSFTGRLIELGYQDAMAAREQIQSFLAP